MRIDTRSAKQVPDSFPPSLRLAVHCVRVSTSVARRVYDVPPLMHGNDWNGQDVAGWWASEKYNGWRAYWDGERLLSRNGNDYCAPAWFLAGLCLNHLAPGNRVV